MFSRLFFFNNIGFFNNFDILLDCFPGKQNIKIIKEKKPGKFQIFQTKKSFDLKTIVP